MNYRFGIDIPWLNGSNISREMATMRLSGIYKLWFAVFQHNLLSARSFNFKTLVLI